VPESGPLGSVRGDRGNPVPYRDTAGWDQSTWANLCGRHFVHHDGLAAWRGTVAAGVQTGPRPPPHAVAPRRDASAGAGQDARSGASRR